MPLNLLKKYSDLLDIAFLNSPQRLSSLYGVFKRDIEDNANFNFRSKIIRPIKIEGQSPMDILFKHLTHEEETIEEGGNSYKRRSIFDLNRSQRLHWIKHHLEESNTQSIKIFSAVERDQRKRKDVIKTFIYDELHEYVIVLEPQRSRQDYYLLTAYHFNKPFGKKKIEKLLKNKLPDIH